MEEKPKNKIAEALKKKRNIKFGDTKTKQSFSKRNKIHVDSGNKRTQNRGG